MAQIYWKFSQPFNFMNQLICQQISTFSTQIQGHDMPAFIISRRALAREGDYEMMSVCACVCACVS